PGSLAESGPRGVASGGSNRHATAVLQRNGNGVRDYGRVRLPAQLLRAVDGRGNGQEDPRLGVLQDPGQRSASHGQHRRNRCPSETAGPGSVCALRRGIPDCKDGVCMRILYLSGLIRDQAYKDGEIDTRETGMPSIWNIILKFAEHNSDRAYFYIAALKRSKTPGKVEYLPLNRIRGTLMVF